MMRHIAIAVLLLIGSKASAGIIGVGGSNAEDNPLLMDKLSHARVVEVEPSQWDRIRLGIEEQGMVVDELIIVGMHTVKANFRELITNDNKAIVVDTQYRMILTEK